MLIIIWTSIIYSVICAGLGWICAQSFAETLFVQSSTTTLGNRLFSASLASFSLIIGTSIIVDSNNGSIWWLMRLCLVYLLTVSTFVIPAAFIIVFTKVRSITYYIAVWLLTALVILFLFNLLPTFGNYSCKETSGILVDASCTFSKHLFLMASCLSGLINGVTTMLTLVDSLPVLLSCGWLYIPRAIQRWILRDETGSEEALRALESVTWTWSRRERERALQRHQSIQKERKDQDKQNGFLSHMWSRGASLLMPSRERHKDQDHHQAMQTVMARTFLNATEALNRPLLPLPEEKVMAHITPTTTTTTRRTVRTVGWPRFAIDFMRALVLAIFCTVRIIIIVYILVYECLNTYGSSQHPSSSSLEGTTGTDHGGTHLALLHTLSFPTSLSLQTLALMLSLMVMLNALKTLFFQAYRAFNANRFFSTHALLLLITFGASLYYVYLLMSLADSLHDPHRSTLLTILLGDRNRHTPHLSQFAYDLAHLMATKERFFELLGIAGVALVRSVAVFN